MKEMRWALRLMGPFRREFLLAGFLGLATVASGLGLLSTSAYLIATAALQPSIADLQVAIVGVRSLGLARGLLRYAERYLAHNITFKLLSQVRQWVYRQVEPLAPAALIEDRSGDLLARLVDDVETMQFFYLRAIQPPLIAAIGIIILFTLLATIDRGMAFILILLLVAAGFAIPIFTNLVARRSDNALLKSRGQLKQSMVELFQGLPELIAFEASNAQIDKMQKIEGKLIRQQNKLSLVDSLNQAGLAGISQLAAIVVLWLLLPLVRSGQVSGVQLALLVVASLASFELVTPMINAVPAMQAGIAAARRLLNLAERKPAIVEPRITPPEIKLDAPGLTIHDLHFSYSQNRLPALNGISFKLPAGQSLALVGSSGAGKSTIFNLLLRFWDYQAGSIHLGEKNIRSFSPDQARSQFSVLSQRTTIFSGTLRQNLLLADPKASDQTLIHALNKAGASELLELAPEGLAVPVGDWGLKLSAGQRQRLALARMLLQDRPYLLLDEPTASLDPALSAQVLSDILNTTKGKTILLITHQLLGLERFDQIAVMQSGQIIQHGTHQQLLHDAGVYRHMWQLQIDRWQIEAELQSRQG